MKIRFKYTGNTYSVELRNGYYVGGPSPISKKILAAAERDNSIVLLYECQCGWEGRLGDESNCPDCRSNLKADME